MDKTRAGPHGDYDVLVVGSGAGGGMAAYVLALAGAKVLMLEAGRDYDPLTETPMFETSKDAPLRGEPTDDKPFGFYDAELDGGWQLAEEPYTVAGGSNFTWWRSRMLGGRTNHWGRVALRYGPYDFRGHSRDGLGADWPITYDELAPWYDRVERLIGVTGRAEGLENVPDSPPGCHQPPPPPRAHEIMLTRAFNSMSIPVAAIRAAILTRPINGRQACFYATSCWRGCAIRANFQSTTVLLPPALATGNLKILTGAHVYAVEMGGDGRAKGVSYIDKSSGQHTVARARAVVLCASAAESARILLNTRPPAAPDGLGNHQGLVGRNLMDTVGVQMQAQIPALEGLPNRNDDGISLTHIYVPWWGLKAQAAGQLDFPRGYNITPWGGGRRMPEMEVGSYANLTNVTYGPALRAATQRIYGTTLGLAGRGEMIPNENSFCELDPEVKDRWGIPVLRFHWQWSEHEIRQAAHMQRTFSEVINKLKGTVISVGGSDDPRGRRTAKGHGRDPGVVGQPVISSGGSIIHEVGVARMGDKPANSVVDSFGCVWGTRNVFIMDGAVLVSSPDKNPTLTIMALAWRASENLLQRSRRGEL